MTVTKTYLLDGLDCPLCAGKIEDSIQKLAGVRGARVDFAAQRLSLEISGPDKLDFVVQEAARLVRLHEPGVCLREVSGTLRCLSGAPVGPDGAADAKASAPVLAHWREYGAGLCLILFACGIFIDLGHPADLFVFLAAYLLVGGEVVLRALSNIARGRVFDENFLMSIATIGAFAIGEYAEGVAVMLFYQVGEAFQRAAVGRSRKSIAALMDIRPDYANLKTAGGVEKVSPDLVPVGAEIIVRPGEKIPLDGIVLDGRSALDTSALTGESLPRDVEPGGEVLSGSINTNGLLTIRVTKIFGESTVSKILELVQNAGGNKSRTEDFIKKFARSYTPAVVFAALMLAFLPPLLVPDALFSEWLSRALVFLVVSCPCALVISIPLSFFGGIGGASRNGVLVKGGNYLEALNSADTVVFDKTGTLTKGKFAVTDILPANGFTPEELLRLAAHAESASTHPIAASIRAAYGKELLPVAQVQEIAGHGVRVLFEGRTILAGNSRLLEGIDHPPAEAHGTGVHIAVQGVYAGSLVIADSLKDDSEYAIEALKSLGIKRVVMLTGDNRAAAERIGAELGLDRVYAELLPHQKVEKLEELDADMRAIPRSGPAGAQQRGKSKKGKLIFVGDGINDAPVLARADIGIAMGGVGSDAAIEAADVVLMTDEPGKVATAIRIARKTRRIVVQNVAFALGTKAVILVLGAAGIATMWEAVFGDVGVALLATLNASRAMKKEIG